MNFTERRKQVFDKMDQDSALLLFPESSCMSAQTNICRLKQTATFSI